MTCTKIPLFSLKMKWWRFEKHCNLNFFIKVYFKKLMSLKTPGKTIKVINEMLRRCFYWNSFTNSLIIHRSEWEKYFFKLMIALFVFYIDWISVAPTKITLCFFGFAAREFGVGTCKAFTLKNSWKTPQILLSSISEHHN